MTSINKAGSLRVGHELRFYSMVGRSEKPSLSVFCSPEEWILIGCGGGPFPGGDRNGGRRLTPLFAFNNDWGTPDDMGAFDG